ncbi:MAG: DAK2 domain-containing protein, partial [Anaerolineaceae bacterium]|nr:DAK2 domain-containing protein [Anaerolineaceae bacterium]
MAHALAQGALMGARGNSGVILSQIWRGFARALDDSETMDAKLFVKALQESRNTAYKGVVRPVEGTILTVIKDISIQAEESLSKTAKLSELLVDIVEAGTKSVANTPELLPVLKQAGVVDSGGKGLLCIFEGMLRFLQGDSLDVAVAGITPLSEMNLGDAMDAVEPGQDYEVVIDFAPNSILDLEAYYKGLSDLGTSIQVGEGEGIYRMHIHVPLDNRYQPIDYTMTLGTIQKVMMENLVEQMERNNKNKAGKLKLAPVNPDEIAVIAVSPGHGLSKIFASLGVAAIVEGGQTMNPSVKQILEAFENLPTDKVIILPNNKNIILAAQKAASVTVKKVVVIPTINTPQGFSAMLRLSPEGSLEENEESMIEALSEVETGEITTATRSVEIDKVQVKKGQVIALLNGKLIASTTSIEEACDKLLEKANLEDYERVTLFYGENMTLNQVNQISDRIKNQYDDLEVEIHEGGQAHYQLILAIE